MNNTKIKNVLVLGAGGVAHVTAHKCAQNNDVFGNITVASRTKSKCDAIIESIHRKNNLKTSQYTLTAEQINVEDVEKLVELIKKTKSGIVINVAAAWVAPYIMEACCQAKAVYIDTSICTDLCSPGQQVPQCYDPQWAFRDKFKEAGIGGLLGIGFDPGLVSVYAKHIQNEYVDEIDSIDIFDINAGNHGRKWATNFDPECNLLEIQGDSFYFENKQWKQVPCHSRKLTLDFPEVGRHSVYSMAHDEVRSLAEFIPAKKIEFWMGFSDNYLKYFNVLRDIGMLSSKPVTMPNGQEVVPLQVLKQVLPDPATLAPDYTGKTCIGTQVKGKKDSEDVVYFLYNICDHKKCYEEVEAHAISYTAGLPPVAAALLVAEGKMKLTGLLNVEQVAPLPIIKKAAELGLGTEMITGALE